MKTKKMIAIIDSAPRHLLTHKKLLERITSCLGMVESQAKRVDNKKGWRKSIYYRPRVDEHKIEIFHKVVEETVEFISRKEIACS